MNIKGNLSSLAYWCSGGNNVDSLKKLNKKEYLFNEDPNGWNIGKQYVEESAIILTKWAALVGTPLNLAIDTGFLPPPYPFSSQGVVQTIGSYPYSAFKWMVTESISGSQDLFNYAYDTAVNSDDKQRLIANSAIAISTMLSFRSIWKGMQRIEEIKDNPRFSCTQKTWRLMTPMVNMAVVCTLPLLAYMDPNSESATLLATALLISQLMPGAKRGISVVKPLIIGAMVAVPLYDKIASLVELPSSGGMANLVNNTVTVANNLYDQYFPSK